MRPSLKTNLLDAIIFIGNSSRIDVLNTAASVTESDHGRLIAGDKQREPCRLCLLKIEVFFVFAAMPGYTHLPLTPP